MRLVNIVLAYFIAILFLLTGCNHDVEKDKKSRIYNLSELPLDSKPVKHKINQDSLIIRIPGKDGVELPEENISNIPDKIKYLGINSVIPGKSILKQSVNEQLNNKSTVKSKKPVIIDFVNVKEANIVSMSEKQPIVTPVLSPLYLEYDSLRYRKKIAIRKGLYKVQANDTIFPPISLLADNPIRVKASPFYYKENTLFDICILDANQELPNPFIRVIEMDKNNIMWFETHTGGLISYDGLYFDQYVDKRRLNKQTSESMLVDSKGNIWSGTKGGGVFCFDGTFNTQYKFEHGLISDIILDIIEDENGNIWFATINGITKFDGATFSSYSSDHGLLNDYVFTLFEDDAGNIWCGTMGGGVTKFNGNEFFTYTKEDGLCGNNILSISQDHEGNYWFGSYFAGISKFNGTSFTNYCEEQGLGESAVLAIIEDDDDNIWFGTHGNGVLCFNGSSFTNYTVNEGLCDNYCRTITEDNKGNLWIGSDGAGLSKININSFKHYTSHHGLSNSFITSIYEDNNDRLLFSPYSGGVMICDKLKAPGQLEKFIQISTEQGLAGNIVVSISQDKYNNYWFGTYFNGVSKLDAEAMKKGKLKFVNYGLASGLNDELVRIVFHDDEGNVWFGTEGGVTKFDGENFTTITKKNGLGDNIILSIFQDLRGNMWFGTMDGGVSCLSDDTLINYTKRQGLGSNTVWAITEDKNGILWFGTSKGITGFNGKAFRTLDNIDGLSNNAVFSMVLDNMNQLWIGTIKGLNQIKLPKNDFFTNESNGNAMPEIFVYGRMDGLKGLDFASNSVLLDNMNCLWWGTDKSLTMLDLATFKAKEKPPVVHINGIGINNEHVDFTELFAAGQNYSRTGIRFNSVTPFMRIPIGLSIPYDMNYIAFSYSATDWSSPNQIQYQYKIEGFDKDWSLSTKEYTADYRNLPSGRYVFRVRAKGKSGIWSSSFDYPFVIRWPWYKTWWSSLLFLIVFVSLIWLLVRWRVSIVQKQKGILAKMVNERTKELDKALILSEQAAEAKNQFIATISHELRTPLNAILGLSHLAINNTVDPNQEDYLYKIDRSAVTLLSLINEILDFSKIEAGKMQLEKVNFDLDMVINSVIELNAQSAKDKNLEFVINVSPDIPNKLIGDPLRIGQIITNCCNNAIKFTTEGEIVVNIEIEEEINKEELYLQVSVKDSGIGISEDQMQTLFDEFKQADTSTTRKYGGTGLGLTICKLIIEMMDGQIWLESEVGKGTTFFFNLRIFVQKDQLVQQVNIPDELKHYNILVCDDNQEARNSIYNILKSHSLIVDAVSSGEEVMELFKEKQFDLLIIDLQLEGMSGLDTILRIRANDEFPSIKTILLLDTLVGKESFERNIAGIDGYILKPAVRSTVINKVLAAFGMEEASSSKSDEQISQIDKVKKLIAGKHVLIAEDNELNKQVLVGLVTKVGITVDCVENGAQALEKALVTRYDLILMDLHMPVMDGYNSSAQIREKGIKTPIIAVTADAMRSVTDKCKDSAIDDLITKPINPGQLYKQMVYWMSGNGNGELLENIVIVTDEFDLSNINTNELDIVSGIRRLGDDKPLYFKMLTKFLATSSDTIYKLRELIREESTKQVHLLAHSLKGESSNLGAKMIAKHAETIELIAKDNKLTNDEIALDKLDAQIKKLKFLISEIIPEVKDGNVKTEIRSLIEISQEMIVSLEQKDPKIFDLLDELEDNYKEESGLNTIIMAIKNDNINQAISILKKLS